MSDREKTRLFYVAVKGIVMRDGKALIIRRRENPSPDGRDWWEFPGGTLEYGESPEQTLVREVGEETGLRVSPGRLLYVWSWLKEEKYEVIIITYLCESDDRGDVCLSEEHTGYLWADRSALREYLADDIKNALDSNHTWEIIGME